MLDEEWIHISPFPLLKQTFSLQAEKIQPSDLYWCDWEDLDQRET